MSYCAACSRDSTLPVCRARAAALSPVCRARGVFAPLRARALSLSSSAARSPAPLRTRVCTRPCTTVRQLTRSPLPPSRSEPRGALAQGGVVTRGGLERGPTQQGAQHGARVPARGDAERRRVELLVVAGGAPRARAAAEPAPRPLTLTRPHSHVPRRSGPRRRWYQRSRSRRAHITERARMGLHARRVVS